MDDETRVAAIRERAEAAPTGPWSTVLNANRTWNYLLVYGGTADEYLLAKIADDDATDLMVNAHEDIPWLLDRLRAAEARAAEAEAIVVAPMEATSVLGSTDAEMIQYIGTAFESTRSEVVLARVKAEVWDACLDAIEQHELNTAQAREGNPHRTEVGQ